MESIWDLGIAIIIALQALGDWLVVPMQFFSFLGSEEFFLLVLPVLYWSVNADLGLRVGVILLLNGALNTAFKLAMFGPRPYWYSLDVKAFAAETSFGVPSGHSQIAAGVWGMLAARMRHTWAWVLAIFVIFMIGLSRLFLGVHFLHDVLLGWLLGALVLWGVLRLWDPLAAWLAKKTLAQQVGLAFGFSMLLVILAVIPYALMQGRELPAFWIENAAVAHPDELPEPISLGGVLNTAGTLFGLLAGLAWLNTQGRFRADGTLQQRVLRYLLGLVGVGLLWFGLGAVFPRGEELLPYILRFLRYALVGLWVAAGAPWLFVRLKLSSLH